ncbi:ROK family protein [Arcanobacterium hippocoleae]
MRSKQTIDQMAIDQIVKTGTVSNVAEILALDIGGTKIGWAIVRYVENNGTNLQSIAPFTSPASVETIPDFEILREGSIPTCAMEGGSAVLSRIVELAAQIQTEHPEIAGVSVASAGVIDPNTGAVISATGTMPGWGGTPLGASLQQAAGIPVEVINDVHAHGLGEAKCGAGKGAAGVLSIAVGTGIGGALITDGKIVFGNHFLAGHYGHIHHSYAAGMECSCGRAGHIEAISSGSGITAWYNARAKTSSSTLQNPIVANGRELQELADNGNKLAKKCFKESAYALGEVLGSLANCADPSIIVISGSMTRSGKRWWRALEKGYAASAMDGVAQVPLVLGELGGNAPLIGASINFFQKHLSVENEIL